MKMVGTFAEVRDAAYGSVGFVPTMGYLHEGHVALMLEACRECDTVVASIFVNALQFGPGEDLATYPRDLDRDSQLAKRAGVDLLFVPDRDEVYPDDEIAAVELPDFAGRLEGERRPGHFQGVATVVELLLAGIDPDRAYFGLKDAQQLALVNWLVGARRLSTTIVPVSTRREPDGLALSSRNRYLKGESRVAASALSRGLFQAADAVEAGEADGPTLEGIVSAVVADAAGIELDYAALVTSDRFEPLEKLQAPAVLAVAANVSETHLIDNVAFFRGEHGIEVDRGVVLERPSVLEEN
jgi:pantoate--beta-alanine ligase